MLLYVDAQFASPYAMSSFVALVEKGLSFKTVALDLAANENRTPAYAKTSLTQRVPTLVDHDFTLSESSAIAEYLSEIYPGISLYPSALRDRARARQVQAWLRSDLLSLRQERPTEVIFYRPVATPLSQAAQNDVEKLLAVANELFSHGGEHLFGSWCIADVDLALMLNRLVLNGDAVPSNLKAYAATQWKRPSVQQWVQRPRPPL